MAIRGEGEGGHSMAVVWQNRDHAAMLTTQVRLKLLFDWVIAVLHTICYYYCR